MLLASRQLSRADGRPLLDARDHRLRRSAGMQHLENFLIAYRRSGRSSLSKKTRRSNRKSKEQREIPAPQ